MNDDLRERLARAIAESDPVYLECGLLELHWKMADAALAEIGEPGPSVRKTEFAAMLAVHCNGGDWSTDYTEDQKNIWRGRAERLRKDPSATEPAPQGPEKYTIGDLTMDKVFRAAGMTNVSDMQAVFDQVEVALRHAIEPAPVSVAALRAIAEGKDDE